MRDLGSFILNLSMVIAAVWIVYRFWGSFFEKKRNTFLSIVVWISYFIFQMLNQCNRGNVNLLGTFINIVLILMIVVCGYNSTGKIKYFLLLLFCSVWSLLEEFVFFLLSGIEREQGSLDVIGVVISNILMIILVYMVSVTRSKKNGEFIPNKFYLFLLMIPVGSIYIAINQLYDKGNKLSTVITTCKIGRAHV